MNEPDVSMYVDRDTMLTMNTQILYAAWLRSGRRMILTKTPVSSCVLASWVCRFCYFPEVNYV